MIRKLAFQKEASHTRAWSWVPITFVIIFGLLIAFSSQYLLINDDLYLDSLAEQMSSKQIQEVINQSHRWSWMAYIVLPLFTLIKFIMVASCLSLGYYFSFDRWIFKPFFQIAIQAEVVLLIPTLIKLLWFILIQPNYSLRDLQTFYPLSVLSLVGPDSVAPYLLYPLQLTNLFELAYWLVLAYGVSQVIDMPMPKAVGLVAASYGSGLLVWVALVMFLTVSLS